MHPESTTLTSGSSGRAGSRGAALLALAVILGIAAAPAARGAEAQRVETWRGQVERWTDGDTLWVTRSEARGASGENSRRAPPNSPPIKIRLHWADAPEVAHTRHGVGQAAGVAALEFVQTNWPPGTVLDVRPRGMSYDRIVADLACDGVDVAEMLTRAGLAWNDPRYKPSKPLVAAEAEARKARRGLWNDKKFGAAVPPWEWRQEKRRELRGARVEE